MAKKTTFRHMTPDGTIYTRQSARAYTHVVVRAHNNSIYANRIERERVSCLQNVAERARENWQEFLITQAAGVGGQVPYFRGQGGYDGRGRTHVCEQWEYDHCMEYLRKYPTHFAYVQARVNEESRALDDRIATILKRSEEYFVASWHHSAALADKATRANACPGDVSGVEAINHGQLDTARVA